MQHLIYKFLSSGPLRYLVKRIMYIIEKFINYKYPTAGEATIPLDIIRDYNRKRELGPKKIICNAPFKHMYFKQNGFVTACCVNGSDTFGHVSEGSILDIWNGKLAGQFRDRIRHYNLGGGCTGCQHFLEAENYHAFAGRMYDEFLPVRKRSYPTEITFELSNTCNLECVMCSGEFSNLIRKNVERLPDATMQYDERFFHEIMDILPHLKVARFIGGEPFLIRQYYPMMEFLVEHNPGCRVYIQTNGTILNHAVRKIITGKNVEISISLDSLNRETYESIRKNATFGRMQENLAFFSERALKYGQSVNINYCLMNNNWSELPEFIRFCDNNNFTLNVIPVEFPRDQSLRICKKMYLEKIVGYYTDNSVSAARHGLSEVFNETVSYIRYLVDQADTVQAEKSGYLRLSEIELLDLIGSGMLFSAAIPVDERQEIVELIRLDLTGLSETNRKNLVVDFIMELNLVRGRAEGAGLSRAERMAKTSVLLNNMKDQLCDNEII